MRPEQLAEIREIADEGEFVHSADVCDLLAELDRVMPVYEAAAAWVNDHQSQANIIVSQANIIVAVRAAEDLS